MILQSLYQYYRRRAEEPHSEISPLGFSREKISFALVLSSEGRLIGVKDLRDAVTDPNPSKKGKPKPPRLEPRLMLVPRPEGKRTSGVKPYFLWDKADYLFGAAVDPDGSVVMKPQHFAASAELHTTVLTGCDDPGGHALTGYFASGKAGQPEGWRDDWPPWADVAAGNAVFTLAGVPGYLHDRPALRALWLQQVTDQAGASLAQCLVTGERQPVALLHPDIRGVFGAQSSGALMVSFNSEAFCSYGRTRDDGGSNAPISREAAAGYGAALNDLLRKGGRQSLLLGDTTLVFWAERATPVETDFTFFIDPPTENEEGSRRELDAQTTARVRAALGRLSQGQQPDDTLSDLYDTGPEVRFFILGLAAPSGARLTVRCWITDTLGNLLLQIGQHYQDMELERRGPFDQPFPPLWTLLRETALGGKSENIPSRLSAEVMRAALTGAEYPQTLLPVLIGRLRAEAGKDRECHNFHRMSLLKAVLVRRFRLTCSAPMEIKMSLDPEEPNVAYRLGRLFAALEKAQQDALGQNINATIRDRFYGRASSAPAVVFPTLLRLAQHHISKAEYGGISDRRIQDIVQGLSAKGFPPHLSLEDQGLFAIGYYHQRNENFKKSPKSGEAPLENQEK